MSEVKNKIGEDFTTFGLFKFAFPTFVMNVVTRLFKSLDDALFISKFVGEKALAGINILNPLLSFQLGISHLFSLGSANISARYMGEKNPEEAKRVFSRIVISAGVVGCLFALIINVFSTPILKALGADETLVPYSLYHIRIVLAITPITLISAVFNTYYATSGKTKMGMLCSIVNGSINIGLDIILVAYLKLGVLGASIATALGDLAVFFIGVIYYSNKKNEIYFVAPEGKFISASLESAKYALPQFVNSCSIGFVSLYTNKLLLALIGSTGIAANTIISDIRAVMTSGLIGVAQSCGPVISYNYGSKNPQKLKRILFSMLKIWIFGSICLMTIGFIGRKGFVGLFMNETSTQEFYDLALFGLTIEILAIPFTAGCVTISRTFIALTNAKTSIILSIFRQLIFRLLALLILPKLLHTTGIWLAIPVAEACAFLVGCCLLYHNRNNYGYGKSGQAKKMLPNDSQ